MNSRTLYQRVLGKDFSKLPLVLQQFHSRRERSCAEGMISVERGTGLLHCMAAGVLQLPRPGTKIPLRLQVVPQGAREIWTRHFEGQCLETVQWQEGSFLAEKAGPICFVFQLAADENGLTFYPRPNQICGLQIPERTSLRVNARAQGLENRWHIEVIISAPLLGTITTYKGEVIPRPC